MSTSICPVDVLAQSVSCVLSANQFQITTSQAILTIKDHSSSKWRCVRMRQLRAVLFVFFVFLLLIQPLETLIQYDRAELLTLAEAAYFT